MAFDFKQPEISCGVTMCWHLENNLEKFILAYSKQLSRVGEHYRTVIFSDSISRGVGGKLALALAEYGDIVKSKHANNPIHDHPIRVYIWHPTEDFIKRIMPRMIKKAEEVQKASLNHPWR